MAVCAKVKNMKIKILFAAIAFVVLTVLSAAGFYIYKELIKPEVKEGPPATIGEGNPPAGGSSDVLKETRLIKDGFEIILPPGWQEATSSSEGFLLLAFDGKEDVSIGNFQKLDFRTNLSVKSDDLGKYSSLDTLEKYVESMKISLIQAVPGINFIQEGQKTINGAQAIFIECSSRQRENDFKTLLIFVKGSDSAIYAISFNTFQGSWLKYKGVFEQIAQSFKLKYKIGL